VAEPSDGDIVQAVIAGDTAAFAVLVRRYRRAAVVRATIVLGRSNDAEDVAQDAFVQAYAQLVTCRDASRFRAWLMTIVQRRALNHRRTIDRRRTAPLTDDAPAAQPSPLQTVARRQLRARLLAALGRLSSAQREVVIMADLEELSHAEIAKTLRISEMMSRRHLSDARRRLRALLAADIA
jgi:RNA polymerase sigma-70 factor (ECF subfamily)